MGRYTVSRLSKYIIDFFEAGCENVRQGVHQAAVARIL